MKVSPLVIEIMIECATCSEPGSNIPDRMWNSEGAAHARDELRENGLIDDANAATERGRAWVDFICKTPLPVQTWVLPSRTEGE